MTNHFLLELIQQGNYSVYISGHFFVFIPQLVQAVFSGNDAVLTTHFHVEKEALSGGKFRYTIVPKTKEGFPLFLSATVIKAADVKRVYMTDAAKNRTTILFTHTRHARLTQSEANREFQDQ